jgi:ketosteroid isomerase-like protein
MVTHRLTTLLFASILLIMVAPGCNQKKQNSSPDILYETERYYSALSAEKGMNASFLEMFDSAGVILRANHQPIEGYDSIKAILMRESDTTFTLTWEPRFAKLAASGEMGYTYGTYQVKDKATDSIIGVGKYATVWIKHKDGKWKAILDTGNPGLGN